MISSTNLNVGEKKLSATSVKLLFSISSEENEAEVDRWAKELAVQFSKSRKFHDKFLKSLNKAGN